MYKGLNTPQENRVILIQDEAKKINNFVDCDVIQDAKETLASDTTLEEVLHSIDYLITSIEYRTSETPALKRIKKWKQDIKDYTSLLYAQSSSNPFAIKYFEKEMKSGRETRIM